MNPKRVYRLYTMMILLSFSHLMSQELTWEITPTSPLNYSTYLNIISDSLGNLFYGGAAGIYRSTDEGETWTKVSSMTTVKFIITWNQNIYALSPFANISYSTNRGLDWKITSNFNLNYPSRFAVSPNGHMYVRMSQYSPKSGKTSFGILKSIDNGLTFQEIAVFPNYDIVINDLLAMRDDVLLLCGGIPKSRVLISSNEGTSWSQSSVGIPESANCLELFYSPRGTVFCRTDIGIYRSNDLGTSWQVTEIPNLLRSNIAINPRGEIYSILDSNTVIVSNDDGKTIAQKKTGGLPKIDPFRPNYYLTANSKGRLFATCFESMTVYRTKEGLSNVRNSNSNKSPIAFNLFQNYPNPFNPETKITFSLSQEAHVSIIIYNSIGQEVNILVNDIRHAGKYEIEFNGKELSSGTYFYVLKANGEVQSKSMILIR